MSEPHHHHRRSWQEAVFGASFAFHHNCTQLPLSAGKPESECPLVDTKEHQENPAGAGLGLEEIRRLTSEGVGFATFFLPPATAAWRRGARLSICFDLTPCSLPTRHRQVYP